MKKRIIEGIEVETSSGNIYADLGYPDAEEMHIKAQLASKIGEIVKHKHLTQQQAAAVVGLTQPKLSGMLRGQFRGISETKMLECLARLGRDIQIVVKTARNKRPEGRIKVVFA